MDELLDRDDIRITSMVETIERITENIGNQTAGSKPIFNGEIYITDSELSDHLKVSRRTLQEWRNTGQIAYIPLSGKILYRESDVLAMLEKNYCKPR